MADPLGQKLFLEKFHSISELVRTVHVSVDEDQYRIEVHKNHAGKQSRFSVICFIRKHAKPADAEPGSQQMPVYLVDVSFPWVDRNSADGALGQALGFLEECKRGKSVGAGD